MHREVNIRLTNQLGTIRNAYKHLYNDREKLIDKAWYENGKGDLSALPQS
jgi:transcription initiation factor TFIIB